MNNQNIIIRTIQWLTENRSVNVLLVFLYSLVILFLHDPFVKIVLHIKDLLTLSVFNYVVSIISMFLLLTFIGLLVNQLLKTKSDSALKLFYLFILSGIMVLHSLTMFEMKIEVIHSFEYSVLAFLLFPLFSRFGAVVIFALPVMFIDEWLQYQVMYLGYVEYFELNDILMDTYGCGFTMIAIWISGAENKGINKHVWRTPEFVFLTVLIVTVSVLLIICVFSLYPETKCNNTWLVLNQLKNPHQFWQVHPIHGSTYHVMKPIEGLIAITLSCLFFSSIDFLKKK